MDGNTEIKRGWLMTLPLAYIYADLTIFCISVAVKLGWKKFAERYFAAMFWGIPSNQDVYSIFFWK